MMTATRLTSPGRRDRGRLIPPTILGLLPSLLLGCHTADKPAHTTTAGHLVAQPMTIHSTVGSEQHWPPDASLPAPSLPAPNCAAPLILQPQRLGMSEHDWARSAPPVPPGASDLDPSGTTANDILIPPLPQSAMLAPRTMPPSKHESTAGAKADDETRLAELQRRVEALTAAREERLDGVECELDETRRVREQLQTELDEARQRIDRLDRELVESRDDYSRLDDSIRAGHTAELATLAEMSNALAQLLEVVCKNSEAPATHSPGDPASTDATHASAPETHNTKASAAPSAH
ncbi:MAG: hypothetical protein R3B90_03425 [Planctomycetaceae bacterium]